MMAKQSWKGVKLIILSSFFYALMSAFVNMAGDLPFFQKALFRNSVALIVSGIIILAKRVPMTLPRASWGPLACRIILGFIGVVCNYYAIDRLVLASSNSLQKLSPFFAILFAALFLKERVSRAQAGCIIVALAGSLFLIFPNLKALGLSSCIALLGGISTGGAHVSLRALRSRSNIDGSVIVFLFSLVSTILTAVPCALYWSPMEFRQVLCLLLAGASCAIAQYALTGAYRYAAPREISIYDCTQIIFSGLLGYLLFRQVPDGYSLIAYTLIIAASALLFAHYRRTDRCESQKEQLQQTAAEKSDERKERTV